jgi:hypothetical protein
MMAGWKRMRREEMRLLGIQQSFWRWTVQPLGKSILVGVY